MPLNKRQDQQLQTIIALIEDLRRESARAPTGGTGPRRRRSATDAQRMREEILAARAKGVPAAKLAMKYGVSKAYIYMITSPRRSQLPMR